MGVSPLTTPQIVRFGTASWWSRDVEVGADSCAGRNALATEGALPPPVNI